MPNPGGSSCRTTSARPVAAGAARELVALDWHRRWNCLPPPWSLGVSVGGRGEEAHVTMEFVVTNLRSYTLPVTGNEPVEDQVRRFVERIDASDPRD